MNPKKEEVTRWAEQIEEMPQLFREAVVGLTDEQLDTPYRDGGWTVRQVVHHVADSHMFGLMRWKLLLTEDTPTLKPYDQEAWAELPDTKRMPIDVGLALIDGVHEKMGYFIRHLSDTDLTRTGHHPERGEILLWDQIKLYCNHGYSHLKQITDLKERMGW